MPQSPRYRSRDVETPPAPLAIHSGMPPSMNAKAVIKGRDQLSYWAALCVSSSQAAIRTDFEGGGVHRSGLAQSS